MRALVAVLLLASSLPALAHDYPHADIGEYYDQLRMPDRPSVSCCGAGDAYYADQVDACGPGDRVPCAVVAIVTDTRPDAIQLKDRMLHRIPVAPGTRISVPPHKVRRPPIPNPTDHNIVFLSRQQEVLCWEPQPGL